MGSHLPAGRQSLLSTMVYMGARYAALATPPFASSYDRLYRRYGTQPVIRRSSGIGKPVGSLKRKWLWALVERLHAKQVPEFETSF